MTPTTDAANANDDSTLDSSSDTTFDSRFDSSFDTCIIGAGWSGILACKYFKAAGFNPVVLERNAYFGGVWRHDPGRATGGVMASTFTTSSKTVTEMSDFPMPDEIPHFPRHSQIMDYLHDYVEHFELEPHFRLGNGAAHVEKHGDGWRVTGDDGAVFAVARVVVCSGVHQEATDSGRGQFADFPGEVIHSTRLESRLDELRGKRVLLVGSGETASDVATEISRLTPHLACSSPNGQWIVSRVSNLHATEPFLLDHMSSPAKLLTDPFDAAFWGCESIETFYGRSGHGIPEWQTDRPYQGQFLNKNPSLIELWRAGQLVARPRIAAVEGATVSFVDGARDDYDVIVLCTGFDTVFPFLPAPYDTRPVNDHFKMILSDDDSLSFVGFARPVVGSIPAIAEMQARCLAAMYAGEIPVPGNREAVIARDKAIAMQRFQSKRLSGLVDMAQYITELALWLGAQPDYLRLVLERPWNAVTLLTAPYNGARMWLNDPGEQDRVIERLKSQSHPFLSNAAMWGHALYTNIFPRRPERTYHTRRFMGLRKAVGLVLSPFFMPAAFMMGPPTVFKTVYGAAMLLALSPALVWRRIEGQRKHRRILEDFAPAG